MVSSTASRVHPESPTRFAYTERDGVLWGDYARDTVSIGRFVGTRTDRRVEISFVHRTLDGAVVTGSATSVLSVGDDGLLLLTEDFVGPDGADHVSVCREVPADAA